MFVTVFDASVNTKLTISNFCFPTTRSLFLSAAASYCRQRRVHEHILFSIGFFFITNIILSTLLRDTWQVNYMKLILYVVPHQ